MSTNQYFDKDIIELKDGKEVFLDIGCFDFNTTTELKKRCNTKHVYAFEPDKYNYSKCEDRIKELVSDYRLYLRHYSNELVETVLYAV